MRLKSFLFGIIFVVFANCVFAQEVIPIQAKRNAIVEECKEYIGTPYLYGGLTKDGIDCSGFVFTTVRDSAGIQLPRTVKALYSFVSIIPEIVSGLREFFENFNEYLAAFESWIKNTFDFLSPKFISKISEFISGLGSNFTNWMSNRENIAEVGGVVTDVVSGSARFVLNFVSCY